MLMIGIDYGISNGDLSMFVVAKRENGTANIIDSGFIDEFNYEKYVASEHQIVGEKGDLERFQIQFLNKNN